MTDNLADKLAQLRAAHCARLPTPEVAVLSRATTRIRRSGLLQKCLQPGETVPDFEFIDSSDRHTNLYDLLATGPMVASFFRGFWCPFCKTELEAYDNAQGELEALGCHFIAITPQKPAAGVRLPRNYQVVFDKDSRIARQFGIVYSLAEDEIELLKHWGIELDRINESERWELPVPATYLIDTDRIVAYQFVDPDFRCRCCPGDLMEEVRQCCR